MSEVETDCSGCGRHFSVPVEGRHWLICGDAMNAADVARIRGVGPLAMLLTDPPYGISLDTDYRPMVGPKTAPLTPGGAVVSAKLYAPVIGDDRPFDAGPVRSLVSDIAEQFWFGANYYRRTLSESDSDGSWLVWDKRNESSDAGYGSGFELIWSARRHKQDLLRFYFFGAFGVEGARRVHPTQKPSPLLAEIMTRWSSPGDVILDLFAGSGSTLIAAERTGRRARLLEIDPRYCDVIVRRWEELTGQKAVRVETVEAS